MPVSMEVGNILCIPVESQFRFAQYYYALSPHFGQQTKGAKGGTKPTLQHRDLQPVQLRHPRRHIHHGKRSFIHCQMLNLQLVSHAIIRTEAVAGGPDLL